MNNNTTVSLQEKIRQYLNNNLAEGIGPGCQVRVYDGVEPDSILSVALRIPKMFGPIAEVAFAIDCSFCTDVKLTSISETDCGYLAWLAVDVAQCLAYADATPDVLEVA